MFGRWLTAATLAATLLTLTFSVALGTTHCQFVLGFADLKALIDEAEGPDKVGECLENQRSNPVNGDALQQTTGGLMAWRKLDNWTAFTDGYRTWINGPNGLQARLNTESFDWETAPPIPTPTPIPDFGDWVSSSYTDALTNVTTKRAIVEAHTRQGDGDELPDLIIRCKVGVNAIQTLARWYTYIADSDSGRQTVKYRFDSQPIVEAQWRISNTEKSVFDDRANDWQFLRALVWGGHRELALQVTRYDDSTMTGVFNVAGSTAAYERMLSECGID